MQSFGLSAVLERYNLVIGPGWGFRFMFMFSVTVGSIFVMWLGEQISLFGLGNGSIYDYFCRYCFTIFTRYS